MDDGSPIQQSKQDPPHLPDHTLPPSHHCICVGKAVSVIVIVIARVVSAMNGIIREGIQTLVNRQHGEVPSARVKVPAAVVAVSGGGAVGWRDDAPRGDDGHTWECRDPRDVWAVWGDHDTGEFEVRVQCEGGGSNAALPATLVPRGGGMKVHWTEPGDREGREGQGVGSQLACGRDAGRKDKAPESKGLADGMQCRDQRPDNPQILHSVSDYLD